MERDPVRLGSIVDAQLSRAVATEALRHLPAVPPTDVRDVD
jgi:hypothetical protein